MQASNQILSGGKAHPPTFRINDIYNRMIGNTTNILTFFDVKNHRIEKSFDQVAREAAAMADQLKQTVSPNKSDLRCAICGPAGYEWLLAGLACIFAGIEIVAVPENLKNLETQACLEGIGIDLTILGQQQKTHTVFSDVPCLDLESLSSLVASVPKSDEDDFKPEYRVIAFTSGSTALTKLKSFRISADSTEHFTETFCTLFNIDHDDNWVICHPFSHIVHFEYAVGGFGWGYNITLVDPIRLLLIAPTIRPSVLVAVPSIYERLAERIRRRLPKSGRRFETIQHLTTCPTDEFIKKLNQTKVSAVMPEAEAVLGPRVKSMIIGAAPSSRALRRFLLIMGLPVYEGYGMSETQMISCNHPGMHRFDTVGPAWPGVRTRLDENQVIWIRTETFRTGAYLNGTPEQNKETFGRDGWINTGDMGAIEDGLLRVTGRLKETIITNRGKNINPIPIEMRLKDIPSVSHALVYGNNKPYLVALLALRPDSKEVDRRTLSGLIGRINDDLAPHERIVDFLSVKDDFNKKNGMLTQSGKIRRKNIEEKYKSRIYSLFQ